MSERWPTQAFEGYLQGAQEVHQVPKPLRVLMLSENEGMGVPSSPVIKIR